MRIFSEPPLTPPGEKSIIVFWIGFGASVSDHAGLEVNLCLLRIYARHFTGGLQKALPALLGLSKVFPCAAEALRGTVR
jgi:hypothetical protein